MIRLKNFLNAMERFLIRLAVLTMITIVVVQGMMTVDPLRFYLSWAERMEGQSFEYPVVNTAESESENDEAKPAAALATLTIEIEQYASLPESKILINGQEKYAFKEKEILVEIHAGDLLEIDSSYYNFPVNYKIKSCSSNLAYPKKEQVFTGNQSVVMVGEIIVK